MLYDLKQLTAAIKDSPMIEMNGRVIRFRLRGLGGDAWVVIDNQSQIDPPIVYYSIEFQTIKASVALSQNGQTGMRDVWNIAIAEADSRIDGRLDTINAYIKHHLKQNYTPDDAPKVVKPVDPGAVSPKEITDDKKTSTTSDVKHGEQPVPKDNRGVAT